MDSFARVSQNFSKRALDYRVKIKLNKRENIHSDRDVSHVMSKAEFPDPIEDEGEEF